ncbi:flagellin [Phycisphaerales bacterium AB-hyl4]|uniref:Flagellin n=1 Tax=Natronomicrosphaera hydrolytica TaxID=3242702 RepID=A0ABV4U997_9BACT
MSRINTNVGSMLAQRVMNQQNTSLNQSLERLSTGLRINRGGDDPAGLIASENLRSEQAALNAAISNAERADQVVNVAEGGLQEINAMLLEMQSLIGESANDAGLSREEKEANQQQIDAIMQSIDRIASTTSFQGTKLLNGSFDFQVDNLNAGVDELKVHGAKLGSNEMDINVIINQSAQRGGLVLDFDGGLALGSGAGQDRFAIELGGADGSRLFEFASGQSTADMATQINSFTGVTGVSAVASGNAVVIRATEFGSSNFVSARVVNDGGADGSISVLSGTEVDAGSEVDFSAANSIVRGDGQDVGGFVNGQAARGDGLNLQINSDMLNASITLSEDAAGTLGNLAVGTITGGGAKFNLGPSVDMNNEVRLGIGNVAARNLGNSSVGFLSDLGSGRDANVVDGDLGKAQDVVNAAIKEVSTLRGRLGSFQSNVVRSTINSLGVTLENVSAAESAIRDTDFAAETAEMTRSQILAAAATQTLGMANAQPQSVLQLLG